MKSNVVIMTVLDAFSLLCKSTNKWGVFIHIPDYLTEDKDFMIETEKAAPYLNLMDFRNKSTQIMFDGYGVILCDTEEEMEDIFWQTVGRDGPTRLNNYSGPMQVYAVSCNPNGELLNENT